MIASTQATLQHGKKSHYSHRPTYWYDYRSGTIILPDGTVKHTSRYIPLVTLLSGIEKNTGENGRSVNLFLCAGNLLKNKPSKQYFTSLSDGWVLDNFKFEAVQGKYYRAGFKIYLYGTGKYFGEEKDVVSIREAYQTLQSQLDDAFHYPNYMLSTTPAATGRELLRVSLPEGVQYPRLSDDTLDAIYRNCCYQSRIEHFPPRRVTLENGVYIIDGAWMYASCLYHLPTGHCEHDKRNVLATRPNGYRCPGFYYCTVTVPAHWQHIGLLKEWKERYRADEESRYPNTPGETFKCWCTADELVLAMVHGWQVTIHERYYFPEELADPFTSWLRKFVTLRKLASERGDKLLKAAIRNIVLHTVGSFKQCYTWQDYIDISDEQFRQLEETSRNIERFPRRKPGIMSCKVEIPLHRDRQPFVRPEWAATIWGRARAKLAEFALKLPFGDIVSLRTDSIWCASLPAWVQKKGAWDKPGEFVLKDYIPGSWVWPADSGKMRDYVISYNIKHDIPDEVTNSFLDDEED
jgi:hypothetical protein